MAREPKSFGGLSDLELIGRGGFGAVYRANQTELDRTVAVKILSDASFDEQVARRFDRERRAMGSLSQHPGIVTIFDSGYTPDGSPYLVMELMEGGSLSQRLAAFGPLAWDEAVRVVIPICEAVGEAHRAGVLHRDIKPDNILISRYGEPKLSDFGISALLEGTVAATTTVTATVEHAAPEILDAQPPTPQSDIYSLGSTLHTLLTGSSPHRHSADDTMMSILRRVATEPIVPIDGIPDELQAILDGCLATDPQQRPGTAEQLADRLRGLLDDTTRVAAITQAAGVAAAAGAQATPTRVIPRQLDPEPSGPNQRRIIALAAAVFGLLLITLIAFATTRPDPEPVAATNTEATTTTTSEPTTTTTEATTTTTSEPTTTTTEAATTTTAAAQTAGTTRATTTTKATTTTTTAPTTTTTTATTTTTTTQPATTTTSTTTSTSTTTTTIDCAPTSPWISITPVSGSTTQVFTFFTRGHAANSSIWFRVQKPGSSNYNDYKVAATTDCAGRAWATFTYRAGDPLGEYGLRVDGAGGEPFWING